MHQGIFPPRFAGDRTLKRGLKTLQNFCSSAYYFVN